jgi:hypothetical protein
LTLDTGALIAAEKRVEDFWALFRRALERKALITVPAPVLAQAWRRKSAVIARVLQACEVEDMNELRAKRVGNLLADTGTHDIVDAAVVVSAVSRGDMIVTSDADDIEHLMCATGASLRIFRI